MTGSHLLRTLREAFASTLQQMVLYESDTFNASVGLFLIPFAVIPIKEKAHQLVFHGIVDISTRAARETETQQGEDRSNDILVYELHGGWRGG